MTASCERKKKFLYKLDQPRVVTLLICSIFCFSEVVRAIPAAHDSGHAGTVIQHSPEKTTYFFSLASSKSPSYLLRKPNGVYSVSIKKSLDSYQFEIQNGLVVEATVEKRIRNFRAIAKFGLKDRTYRLKKFTLTNRFSFSADAGCPPEIHSIASANLADFEGLEVALEETEKKSEKFIADSCKNLKPKDLQLLSDLKKYFDPKDRLYNDFAKCLGESSLVDKIAKIDKAILTAKANETPSKVDSLKDAITQIAKALEGRSEKQKMNLNPLTIECKKNPDLQNKSPARFDLASGNITFHLKNELDEMGKDQLFNSSSVKHAFTHEFVHLSLSQPNKCSAALEDEIAEDIAKICSSENQGFAKGGDIQIDSPFAPEPSLQDTKLVEQATAIKISEAANSIPIQRVDPASLDYVGDLPSTASAPRAVNASLQAAVAGPMSSFARVADQMASVVIPRAEAQVRSLPGQQKVIVEDVIIPDAASTDPNRFYIQANLQRPGSKLAVQEFGSGAEAATPLAIDGMDPTKAPALGGGPSRGPASEAAKLDGGREPTGTMGSSFGQQLQQAQASHGADVLQSYLVGGITFSNRTLSGDEYKKYVVKMMANDSVFKSALEQNGILISRNGSVITKPKQVSLLYIDTGKALLFGNF